jgi:hypothetical protein
MEKFETIRVSKVICAKSLYVPKKKPFLVHLLAKHFPDLCSSIENLISNLCHASAQAKVET